MTTTCRADAAVTVPPASRRLLLLLPLAACAELRTPRGPLAPPAGLLSSADPGREAVAELAASLRDGGLALRNDPARTARSAALLEWLSADLSANPRWAPLPATMRARVGAARDEMRAAVGMTAELPPEQASAALARASRDLAAGNRAAARAALNGSGFRHGGERTLERLADPGPLPNGELALGDLSQEVRRLDGTGGWIVQPAADPGITGTRALTPGF